MLTQAQALILLFVAILALIMMLLPIFIGKDNKFNLARIPISFIFLLEFWNLVFYFSGINNQWFHLINMILGIGLIIMILDSQLPLVIEKMKIKSSRYTSFLGGKGVVIFTDKGKVTINEFNPFFSRIVGKLKLNKENTVIQIVRTRILKKPYDIISNKLTETSKGEERNDSLRLLIWELIKIFLVIFILNLLYFFLLVPLSNNTKIFDFDSRGENLLIVLVVSLLLFSPIALLSFRDYFTEKSGSPKK